MMIPVLGGLAGGLLLALAGFSVDAFLGFFAGLTILTVFHDWRPPEDKR